MSDHLDSDLVAAYGERRLSSDDRAQVEAHLVDCAHCRREVADLVPLLRSSRARRRFIIGVPALAAAAAIAVVVLRSPSVAPPATSERLRPGGDGAREGVSTLTVIAPGEGASAGPGTLRLAWGGGGADALYSVTVADTTGRPVWRAATGDTTLALPDSVLLTDGARYHWWVDVLLPDGRVASTGLRTFVARR